MVRRPIASNPMSALLANHVGLLLRLHISSGRIYYIKFASPYKIPKKALTMQEINLGQEYSQELMGEARATRLCLERIPYSLFDWKPHEKSMSLGYLALLVAEIPKWIALMINESEIDFANFKHFQPKSTDELVTHFDENLKNAKRTLENVTNESLNAPFHLKNDGKILYSAPKKLNIWTSINHLVHHRGQLTVYIRLNNLPVPSIYGPSADDEGF